ncbi:class I SAM-dependent methyltransferase [Methylocapsa aurea]|uniref:class I SAM-dependent methyltransferase n=1 Tax=Methylocapsa aurea TaxID=663610 RepID=UPI00068E5C5F|nr:class I SAM-dependent methyltransferase [Methylocapsa aurea]
MSDFHREAYELQAEFHLRDREIQAQDNEKLLSCWLDDSTSNHWRQSRMYDFAKFFADDDSTWLTIGDGRFGLDSVELRKRGIKNILPSDIADFGLKRAKEKGLIETYALENAEKMSFEDGQFDYVMCKEAYHHFPRPYAALYEMLRVANKGVIIIEPNDYWKSAVGSIAFQLKRLFGKARHVDQGRYEDSGNYVYSVSEREIEKLCLGLDLPNVFFKGLNDVYIAGGEYVPAKWSSPIFLRMRLMVMLLDCLCALRLFKPTRLLICIFKKEPSETLRRRFVNGGWKLVDLPRNPHRQLHKDSLSQA